MHTLFKSLTEQFPPMEGYRVSRCYDFKFEDKGTNCDNYIKVIQGEHHPCTTAMDPLVAKVLLIAAAHRHTHNMFLSAYR